MLGILAPAVPEVMAGGYGWVQWGAIGMPPSPAVPAVESFIPQMSMRTLLVLALLKIVATSFTISSGGSGGVFGPSMLIGGMLGGAFGQLLKHWMPTAGIESAAFVLVGMGGFFAGVSKTPLTSIVMVSEMTGSYSLLVPLMLACALNMAISRRWSIYEEQVATPIDSPAHQGDFVVDVLEQLQVSQVAVRTQGIETVPASMPFQELIHLVARSTETLFPVVDAQSRLTGIFTLHDLRLALVGSEWGPLVLADDLAYRPVIAVTPTDNLHSMRRLTELNRDEIPVVAQDDATCLIDYCIGRELALCGRRSSNCPVHLGRLQPGLAKRGAAQVGVNECGKPSRYLVTAKPFARAKSTYKLANRSIIASARNRTSTRARPALPSLLAAAGSRTMSRIARARR